LHADGQTDKENLQQLLRELAEIRPDAVNVGYDIVNRLIGNRITVFCNDTLLATRSPAASDDFQAPAF